MSSHQLDPDALRRHRRSNLLQATVLLLALGGVLALAGWIVAGGSGIIGMLIGGAIVVSMTPKIGPLVLLRLYGARVLQPSEAPQLHDIVRELARRAGLPRPPRLYYLPSRVLNAFSVGSRDNATVVFSHGLVATLDIRELAGVLAHEVAHVANNDMRIMAIADMATRMTGLMGQIGVFMLIFNVLLGLMGMATVPWLFIFVLIAAPTVSAMLQLALSRNREFQADASAAALTEDPLGLAGALQKIEGIQGGPWERIFLPGRRVPDPSLLRTHPNTPERVTRLQQLARQAPEARYPPTESDVPLRKTTPHHPPRWRLSGLWH